MRAIRRWHGKLEGQDGHDVVVGVSSSRAYWRVDVNDVAQANQKRQEKRRSSPELHDRHHLYRQRTLAGRPSINCARQPHIGSHDARTTRPCPDGPHCGRPPSSARGFGSYSAFDGRAQKPHTEEDARDGPGCTAQEDIRRPEGPGQNLPEPVRPPWRRLEERDEVW